MCACVCTSALPCCRSERQGVVVVHDFIRNCEGWVVQQPAGASFRHTPQGRFGRGAFAARIPAAGETTEAVLLKTYQPPLDLRGRDNGRLVALCAWIYLPSSASKWNVILGVYCGSDWHWCASSQSNLLPGWHRICLAGDLISDPSTIQQMKVAVISEFMEDSTVVLDRVSLLYESAGGGEGDVL